MKGYEFVPLKPPRFTDVYQVIHNAKEAYCWIFNKVSLRWWTPDEVYDDFHEKDFSSIKMLSFLIEISIRDPRSCISAAFKQVQSLTKMRLKKIKK